MFCNCITRKKKLKMNFPKLKTFKQYTGLVAFSFHKKGQ